MFSVTATYFPVFLMLIAGAGCISVVTSLVTKRPYGNCKSPKKTVCKARILYIAFNSPIISFRKNPEMVILQKHENQLYTDIVRTLKQNLQREVHRSSSSETHDERKVRIRTECYYKSQLLDDHWREKYNRHVAQSVRGFYTPAHVPYASVGDVCLDVKDLVLSTIGCAGQDDDKVSKISSF